MRASMSWCEKPLQSTPGLRRKRMAYLAAGLTFWSAAPSTSSGPDSCTKTMSLRFLGLRPGFSPRRVR